MGAVKKGHMDEHPPRLSKGYGKEKDVDGSKK